jgi:hypothetical protein
MIRGNTQRALRGLVWAALAFAVLSPAGCSPQPATGTAAEEYFPMVANARWRYELSSELGNLEMEVTARGSMPLPGGAELFVMDERNLGPRLGFAETSPVGYVVAEGYVARVVGIDYDAAGALRRVGQDEPAWVLPVRPEPGQTWGQQTGLFQTPEGGGAQLGWSGEVKPVTRMTVPAGTFDVIEVQTLYRDASDPGVGPQAIYHDYYARGVGLVRSVVEDPENPANRIDQVLVEYRFPR